MKLLIHEHRHPGHYLHHVRLIAEAALERGIATELSLRNDAAKTEEYQIHIAPIAGRVGAINTFMIPTHSEPTAVFSASGRACLGIARSRGVQHIIVPSADGIAPIWGRMACGGLKRLLPEGTELEVGLIRPSFAQGERGLGRKAKLALVEAAVARAPIGALRITDFPAYGRLKRKRWARRKNLLAVPEPCEPTRRFTQADARRLLGLPADGALVVATGELSARKCPLELAEAFARTAARDAGSRARLLLAGRCESGLAEKLAARFGREIDAKRIILINRLLTDEDLDAAVAAADIVAAAYAGHPGPSGIIGRAMMLDRPVIAHNYGWAAYMVKTFQLGWMTDPLSSTDYASTMERALAEVESFRPAPATQALKSFYSMESFRKHWMLRLRQRMNLPPEEMVRWEDVLQAAGAPN